MDVSLAELWLPIVIGAVLTFVVGAIFWMVSPHHKPDIKALPDEDAFKSAISGMNIPAGQYMWPHCHDATGKKHENAAERYKTGPWGLITIGAAMPNFAKNLAINLIEMLAICAIVGYLTTMALPAGADYMEVFRFAATAGFLGFALGSFSNDAFLGKPGRFQMTCLVDAVVYALLVAGVFAAFWPDAGGVIPDAGSIPIP